MKVVALSDLHGYLPSHKNIPKCDVVCICGDIVPLNYQGNDALSVSWFCLDFVPWTDTLDCDKVIFIAGNHDFFLEHISKECAYKSKDVLKTLLPGNNKSKHKLIYLCDNSIEIDGKIFYGTPWVTGLAGWAFNKTNEELQDIWKKIPFHVDVLLTHEAPNIANAGCVLQSKFQTLNFGNDVLANVLMEKDIRYNFCGHIHSGNHSCTEYKDNCHVCNVSIKDEDYIVKWGKNIKTFEI